MSEVEPPFEAHELPLRLRRRFHRVLASTSAEGRHREALYLWQETVLYLGSLAFAEYRTRVPTPDARVEVALSKWPKPWAADYVELLQASLAALPSPGIFAESFGSALKLSSAVRLAQGVESAEFGVREKMERLGPLLERDLSRPGKRTMAWAKSLELMIVYRNKAVGHDDRTGFSNLIDYYECMTPLVEGVALEILGSPQIQRIFAHFPPGEVVGEEPWSAAMTEYRGTERRVRLVHPVSKPGGGRLQFGWPNVLLSAQGPPDDPVFEIVGPFHNFVLTGEAPRPLISEADPAVTPVPAPPQATRNDDPPAGNADRGTSKTRTSRPARAESHPPARRRETIRRAITPRRRGLVVAGAIVLCASAAVLVLGREGGSAPERFSSIIANSRPGFFPERPTLRCGPSGGCAAAKNVQFNAYTNNPSVDDERPFLSATHSETGDAVQDRLSVVGGDTVTIRAYIDNAGDNTRSDHVATNTRIRLGAVPVPGRFEVRMVGLISSDNASPKIIGDDVSFLANHAFHLRYVPGSAVLETRSAPNALELDDEALFENAGALLGQGRIDGRWPAGFEWSGYVTARFKVVADDSTVVPLTTTATSGGAGQFQGGGLFHVYVAGTARSASSSRAKKCNTPVRLRVAVDNVGPSDVDDVRASIAFPPEGEFDSSKSIAVTLTSENANPKETRMRASLRFGRDMNLTYEPGSARLLDENLTVIERLSDDVVNDRGVSLGLAEVADTRYVEVRARTACP